MCHCLFVSVHRWALSQALSSTWPPPTCLATGWTPTRPWRRSSHSPKPHRQVQQQHFMQQCMFVCAHVEKIKCVHERESDKDMEIIDRSMPPWSRKKGQGSVIFLSPSHSVLVKWHRFSSIFSFFFCFLINFNQYERKKKGSFWGNAPPGAGRSSRGREKVRLCCLFSAEELMRELRETLVIKSSRFLMQDIWLVKETRSKRKEANKECRGGSSSCCRSAVIRARSRLTRRSAH